MKKSLSLLFFILLISFSACKKLRSGPSSATGYAREHGTNLPIQGAQIYAVEHGDDAPGGWNSTTTGYTQSDSNGYFELKWDWKEGSWYGLEALKSITSGQTAEPREIYLNPGKNDNINLKFYGNGYVDLLMKSVSPHDTIIDFSVLGCPSCSVIGMYGNRSFKFGIEGGVKGELSLQFFDLINYHDTFWGKSIPVEVAPRDTVHIVVEY